MKVGNREGKKNCSMPALIRQPHKISNDTNAKWGYHVRTSDQTRLDILPAHFGRNLGHDTLWGTENVCLKACGTKMSTEKHPLYVWNEMMRIEWPHERHTRNTQGRRGHDFNLASIQLLFSLYIFWQPRGAAVVTVPVCVALALLNQGKGSIVLDLGSIYPAESDGRNVRQIATIRCWQSGIEQD